METNILKDGTIKEGTPESVGIASGHIANYLMRLRDIDYDIHSLQIVKDGKLIFANASEPFMLESPHRLLSAAKAIIAAAVLFAVDEGFLSFDSKIIDYFRDKLPTKDLKILRYMIFLQCSQDRIQMRRLCFL